MSRLDKRSAGKLLQRATTSLQTQGFTIGHPNHHLVQEKRVTDNFLAFRKELNSGRHQDIVAACSPLRTFEECMAKIAEMLDIALDGSYTASDIDGLASVLLGALRRRVAGHVQPHHMDSRLVPAEIVEKNDGTVYLEKAAEEMQLDLQKVTTGVGPYTICDSCTTSLECISNRSCGRGKPAMQLGNTMKELEQVRKIKGAH